jgi:hypothetical protein
MLSVLTLACLGIEKASSASVFGILLEERLMQQKHQSLLVESLIMQAQVIQSLTNSPIAKLDRRFVTIGHLIWYSCSFALQL